ncbi:MAG TPA: Clp protease N-terminal domain-containing protein [Phycisphaerae bacterium]|nr:Clp protease N-terminal domain-containing protein [Phycisphaerae bacterium]
MISLIAACPIAPPPQPVKFTVNPADEYRWQGQRRESAAPEDRFADTSMTMNHLSKRADQVIRLAREAARRDECGFVGSEHLLLGILSEGTSLAARLLRTQKIDGKNVRKELDRLTADRLTDTGVVGMLPLTPCFGNIMSRAVNEARDMGDWKVGTIHLLLALVAEKSSTACKALRTLGVSEDSLRRTLEREMALG